jgi:dihydroxy-acid dehydratase
MVVGHVSPEAFEGGLIALIENQDLITIDSEKQLIQLEVSSEEIKYRRKKWRPAKTQYEYGVLAKYASLATPASLGAYTSAHKHY